MFCVYTSFFFHSLLRFPPSYGFFSLLSLVVDVMTEWERGEGKNQSMNENRLDALSDCVSYVNMHPSLTFRFFFFFSLPCHQVRRQLE